MKKNLLLAAFLLGSAISLNAQTVVWSDDFTDEDISDWTLIDADGDGLNWGDIFQVGDGEGGTVTPVSLISRSWQSGVALEPDNWAITPAIDLSAYAGQTITLRFLRQTNLQFPEDKYSVYAGTTTDTDLLLEAGALYTETPEDGAPTTMQVNLSSFAGQSVVYVAFRHYDSTDMDYLSVDDVEVIAGTLSVKDVLASQLSISPNPATNVINIANTSNILVDSASIADLNGRVVKSVAFGGVSEAQINISDLASGVYMVTIASDKGTTTRKVIKN